MDAIRWPKTINMCLYPIFFFLHFFLAWPGICKFKILKERLKQVGQRLVSIKNSKKVMAGWCSSLSVSVLPTPPAPTLPTRFSKIIKNQILFDLFKFAMQFCWVELSIYVSGICCMQSYGNGKWLCSFNRIWNSFRWLLILGIKL